MFREEWNQQDTPHRDGGPFALTPWVRRLLIANAAVYLLMISVVSPLWLFNAFGFNPATAWLQPWTFVTYLFLHSGFLHLALNCLMLFFFGPPVEERLGSPAFARFYFFCGVGGALLSLMLGFIWTPAPIVGASGAIFGVMFAFAFFWPNVSLMVFPLPVPIKAKWLVLGSAGLALFFQISPGRDGIAHLAHLGGFLFGLLYLKGLPYLAERTAEADERKKEAIKVLVPAGNTDQEDESTESQSRRSAPPPPQNDSAEMDRILDKISATGMDSLTSAERRFLSDRSQRLRRH